MSLSPDPPAGDPITAPFAGDHDPFLDWMMGDDAPAGSSATDVAVPGYEIAGELGRGGMGVVYRAEQLALGRTVALKLTLGHPRPAEAYRFLLEAEAMAAVDHPNVVRVYDSGRAGDRPFLAMEFLDGGSLADRLKAGGMLAPLVAADVVAKIARGVQAAHDAGVIHRDLKPGNVLLTADGTPKVTDFGLAKRGGASDLTRTQAVMGTPTYMSPEQARGDTKRAGPAADVYAVGVILYECLTGSVPFAGGDNLAVLRRVIDDEPPTVRHRVPDVPRDIDLICLKCLRKSPRDRYPTAAALADDLERFARGEPVSVRPAGLLERAAKWSRRNPATARLVGFAAVAAGLLLTVALLWAADRRQTAEREAFNKHKTDLERTAAERSATDRQFFALLTQAGNHRLTARSGWTWQVRASVAKAAALPHDSADDPALRDELAAALVGSDAREVARCPLSERSEDGHHLAHHPTRPLLAASLFSYRGLQEGLPKLSIELLDSGTGKLVATLQAPATISLKPGVLKESPADLAFSPDGKWLLMSSRHGQLHRWEVSGDTFRGPTSWSAGGDGGAVAFSPDGRTAYTRGGNWLRAWDTKTWAEVAARDLGAGANSITAVPALERLAVVADKKVYSLDPFDLSDLAPPLPADTPGNLAIAPDERTGLIADGAGLAVLDLFGPTKAGVFGDSKAVGHRVSVSPCGRFVGVAGNSIRGVSLFELASGRRLCDLADAERVNGAPVAFAPDGTRLFVGGRNRVLVYELAGSRLAAVRPQKIERLGGSSDGRLLFTNTNSSTAHLHSGEVAAWTPATRFAPPRAERVVRFGNSHFAAPVRQAGGRWLAGGSSNSCYLWDLKSGQFLEQVRPAVRGGSGVCLGFGPNDRVWVNTGEKAVGYGLPSFAAEVEFTDPVLEQVTGRGAAHLLCGGQSGVLVGDGTGGLAWLNPDGKPTTRWKAATTVATALALSPDESLAAVGLLSGAGAVFRLPSGDNVATWNAHAEQVSALCWIAADTFATGSADRSVSVWRVKGAAVERLFSVPTAHPVRDLAPTADGLALLEGESRGVQVIDLPAIAREFAASGLGVELPPADFPADPVKPFWETPTPPAAASVRTDYFSYPKDRPDDRTHAGTEVIDQIGGDWSTRAATDRVTPDWFRVCYRGWITAPKAGKYTLHLEADDEAVVFLDGKPVGERVCRGSGSITLNLSDKPHRLRVEYTEEFSNAYLRVRWTGPDGKPWAPGAALSASRPSSLERGGK